MPTAATGGGTGEEDSVGIDAEFGGVSRCPQETGVGVLHRSRVGVLGGEAVVEGDDYGGVLPCMVEYALGAGEPVADDEAAAGPVNGVARSGSIMSGVIAAGIWSSRGAGSGSYGGRTGVRRALE